MVNKRCLSDKESSENPEFQIQRKQQRNELSKSISSWCWTFKLDELIQRNPALLENILRPGVQAAVESAIQHHNLSISRNEAEPSNSRKLTLKFEGLLPKKLHTWTDIESEGSSSPLKIVLVDAVSGVVVTDDPLSSARVEIVVLHGDFRIENWTQKQFDDSIVCQRVDKGPLLVGENVVVLDNGSATVKQIRFSDNSSWVKPKMFRLGAKIVSEQDRVREAVTPPFKVLHRRGEAYQKNSVPTLQHEVWHLEGVLKDKKIHKRLNDNKIYKVEDLVQEYQKDPSSLCKILNSPKCWKILAKQITKFLLGNNHTNQSNTVPVCNVAFSAAANQVQPVVEFSGNGMFFLWHRNWADDTYSGQY